MSDMAEIFDLWLQVAAAGAGGIVLGLSSVEDTLTAFGFVAETVEISRAADGPMFAAVDCIELTLGEGRVVQSVCFCGGRFEEAMVAAIMHGASDAAPDLSLGETIIRFDGHSLEWLATLPNFIESVNAASNRSGVTAIWQLIGTDHDKWLQVSVALPFGGIRAEFRLGFQKHAYESGGEVDYFLKRLTVYCPS
jgi:hypothetical protein